MEGRTDTTVRTFITGEGARVEPLVRDRCMLTVISGPSPGAMHTFEPPEMVLGRDPDLAARIDDRGISRRHARVLRVAGAFYVEDLGSTNGTRINGELVRGPRALEDGDRIQLGATTLLRVTLQDEREAELARRLYESAVRDPLTGVFNRGHFEERLAAEHAFAERHGTPLTVALIDLDHFKRINDGFGHQAGDAVLRAVAERIQRTIRTEDVLARYGGEELVVMVRGIGPSGSARMVERIRATVGAAPVEWAGEAIRVTGSVGVVTMTHERPFVDPVSLVAAADRALYAAKDAGRDTVVTG